MDDQQRPPIPRPAPLVSEPELDLPDDTPPQLRSLIRANYKSSQAVQGLAHVVYDLKEELESLEAVVRPVIIAESRRIAARAQLGEALTVGARRAVDCTVQIGSAAARLLVDIFASPVSKVFGAIGFVLAVLSFAGVQMTVFDANRAIESVLGQCPTELTPDPSSSPVGPGLPSVGPPSPFPTGAESLPTPTP